MARALIKGTLKDWTPAKGFMQVGTTATLRRCFDAPAVEAYAGLAGDDNPVHVDAAYAAKTRFKKPIVHGMLYGSLFGTIFGATIPGAIYMSQQFQFKRPVYVGEQVTASVEVVAVTTAPLHTATCKTVITKEDGSVATEGEAVVMLPKPTAAAAGSDAPEMKSSAGSTLR